MIVVFDTETNGFPPSCRIIQMAWSILSFEGIQLESRVSLIRPDGWEVPVKEFWIRNGYSTSGCEERGVLMPQILDEFCYDIRKWDVSIGVAHNMDFDLPIIGSEMKTYGITLARKLRKICTMKTYAEYFGGKWPKLIEAHRELIGEGFEGAHDAMADVNACARIFFEMKKRGIIKL